MSWNQWFSMLLTWLASLITLNHWYALLFAVMKNVPHVSEATCLFSRPEAEIGEYLEHEKRLDNIIEGLNGKRILIMRDGNCHWRYWQPNASRIRFHFEVECYSWMDITCRVLSKFFNYFSTKWTIWLVSGG